MLLDYIVILIKGLRQANETLMIGNVLTPLLSGGNKYSLIFFTLSPLDQYLRSYLSTETEYFSSFCGGYFQDSQNGNFCKGMS